MAPLHPFFNLPSASAAIYSHHENGDPVLTSNVSRPTDYPNASPLLLQELSIREVSRRARRDQAKAERALLCSVASNDADKSEDVFNKELELPSFLPQSLPSFDASTDEISSTVLKEASDGFLSEAMEPVSSSTSSNSMPSLPANSILKSSSSAALLESDGEPVQSSLLSHSTSSHQDNNDHAEKCDILYSSSFPDKCPLPFVSSRSRSTSKPNSPATRSPVSSSDAMSTLTSQPSIQSHPSSSLSSQMPAPEPEGFILVNNRRRRTVSNDKYATRASRSPCSSSPVPRRANQTASTTDASLSATPLRGDEHKPEIKVETYLAVAIKATQVNAVTDRSINLNVPAAYPPREISCLLSKSPPSPAAWPIRQPPLAQKFPTVVVDGQNVGWHYGGNSKFAARGVKIALNYFRSLGVKAVAILPISIVDDRFPLLNKKLADDPGLLRLLEVEKRVFFTAANTHDDFTMLEYAMQKKADLVSNDKFRKEYDLQDSKNRLCFQRFLDEHLIPFTFIMGEFIPNPNPSMLGRCMYHKRTPVSGH